MRRTGRLRGGAANKGSFSLAPQEAAQSAGRLVPLSQGALPGGRPGRPLLSLHTPQEVRTGEAEPRREGTLNTWLCVRP